MTWHWTGSGASSIHWLIQVIVLLAPRSSQSENNVCMWPNQERALEWQSTQHAQERSECNKRSEETKREYKPLAYVISTKKELKRWARQVWDMGHGPTYWLQFNIKQGCTSRTSRTITRHITQPSQLHHKCLLASPPQCSPLSHTCPWNCYVSTHHPRGLTRDSSIFYIYIKLMLHKHAASQPASLWFEWHHNTWTGGGGGRGGGRKGLSPHPPLAPYFWRSPLFARTSSLGNRRSSR